MKLHGFVQAPGSLIVTSYLKESGPLREMRSITCSFSLDTDMKALGLKLVVSMTSVSPSQWPCESPFHCFTAADGCGRSSSGMVRASWIISVIIITEAGV